MKKRYVFFCMLIITFNVIIVPLNLFLIFIPEWVGMVSAIVSVGALVLFYCKGNGKIVSKILLSIFTILTASFILFGAYCFPYWNSVVFKPSVLHSDGKINQNNISSKQAKADVDYVMKYLKKVHPIFINGTPDNIRQAYNQAITNLSSDEQISVSELNRNIQIILSELKDAHTYVGRLPQKQHFLKYAPLHEQENEQLIKVNKVTIDDIFKEKSNLFSYEVESWGMNTLINNLSTLEGLDFLGLDITDGINYTYENSDGETQTVKYFKTDFVPYEEYLSYKNKDNNAPFVSYDIDENKSLAVLTLTSCEYNDEYMQCVYSMFEEVSNKNIKNVAVDLRNNGGGNAMVVAEFIKYLDINSYNTGTTKQRYGIFTHSDDGKVKNEIYQNLIFNGNVYILTSTKTFSSAMDFAEFIKGNKLGIIIGEAPGNTPTGYGNLTIFKLPESGLIFAVSTKQFIRSDTEIKENLVIPDIECSSNEAKDVLFQKIN